MVAVDQIVSCVSDLNTSTLSERPSRDHHALHQHSKHTSVQNNHVGNPNQRSLSLVQHPSTTSRRSEEAPTLRVTARSGALQAPVRPCNCRQLAPTWHRASGESRCRTRTCVAFERRALILTGARVCECGGALRLHGRAQAWHGFERGALTIKARVHYASVSKIHTIFCTLSMAYYA